MPWAELEAMAQARFGDLVKAVVDVERGALTAGGELHADLEAAMLDSGSTQANLWGINLYPGNPPDTFVEFDSMINIRPNQGNRSRSVEDPAAREKILTIVAAAVLPR